MPVLKLQAPFETIIHNSDYPDLGLRKTVILQAIIDASNTTVSQTSIHTTKTALDWIFSYNSSFDDFCNEINISSINIRKDIIKTIKQHYEKHNLAIELLWNRINEYVTNPIDIYSYL